MRRRKVEVEDVDGKRLAGSGGVYRLPRGQNYFALTFSSPNFASGRHTRFECYVNGAEKSVDGNRLVLSGLKPGKYRLVVKAFNSSGRSGRSASSVELAVPIVLWNWLAPVLAAVFGLVAFFAFRRKKADPDIEEDEYKDLSAADREFLEKVDSVIRANLGKSDFTIEAFAKEMCVSKSTLQHKLRAISGESALERIRRLRFDEACKLLKDNKLSVSQIGEETGFSSPSYFSTAFRDYVGCLPSEYLKRDLHKS